MRTNNAVITVAGAATGNLAASFNSDPYPMTNMSRVAIQAVVSSASSLNGTLKIQASCDVGTVANGGLGNVGGVTNWVDVASSSVTITADGAQMWNLSQCAWKWVRVVYTRTAGSGTLALRANAKGEE